jgi:hypothetical protein
VRIQFGTFNDGVGPTAVQYFDSMSLRVCGGGVDLPRRQTPKPEAKAPLVRPRAGCANDEASLELGA